LTGNATLPSGTIDVGDTITKCSGVIIIESNLSLDLSKSVWYFSNKDNFSFNSGPCDDFGDTHDQSKLGIKEAIWKDNHTLNIKAYVSVNCILEIIGGDYEIIDDNLVLKYKTYNPDQGMIAFCNCVHQLNYNFTNLRMEDYQFAIIRI